MMLKRLLLGWRDDPEFEHCVVSLRGMGTVGPALRDGGIPVTALGLSSMAALPLVFVRLRWLMNRHRPDVVQTWMYHADLIGGLTARAVGCRAIAWNVRVADIALHLGVARTTGLIRRACALLSGIVPQRIVYVADAARRSHEALGYDPTRSLVIPNGFALPALGVRKTHRALLQAMCGGLSKDAILIGSAGRFNLQKNHRGFVAAAARVASNRPEAHFVMFGSGVNRENAELVAWVDETGQSSHFHLLGEHPFAELAVGLDLFCSHSLTEGFPNVIAEAMAGGVPCIATDVGDAAMLVADTGRIVPPGDDRALAEALDGMILLDSAERNAYARRARARIARHFTMAQVQGRYAGLYRRMVTHTLGLVQPISDP